MSRSTESTLTNQCGPSGAEVIAAQTITFKAAFIPAWLDDLGLSLIEFRIFCRVSRRGEQRGCFDSVANMAKQFHVNQKKVRTALRSLVERELLVKHARPGGTDLYRLHPRLLGIKTHPGPDRLANPGLGGAAYQPPETRRDSPFQKFNVSCLRCSSARLRIIGEYNEEAGELKVYLFCPSCQVRELLPVR